MAPQNPPGKVSQAAKRFFAPGKPMECFEKDIYEAMVVVFSFDEVG